MKWQGMALVLETDRFFKFDISPANRLAAYQHAVSADGNAYAIETDFMNASGLNKTLGSAVANRVMRLGWAMLHEELSALNPKTLYVGKINGDEISIVIQGDNIPQSALDTAIQNAQQKFNGFLRDNKLSNLEHAREGRDAGFGNFVASRSIEGENSSPGRFHGIIDELWEKISKEKADLQPPETVTPLSYFTANSHIKTFLEALEQAEAAVHLSFDIEDSLGPNIDPIDQDPLCKKGIMQNRRDRRDAFLQAQNLEHHVSSRMFSIPDWQV